MFQEEPAAYLHRQASFITGNFPEDVQSDLQGNVDFFYFPVVEDSGVEGEPLLGAGDLATQLTDSEAAKSLMRYMAKAESWNPWAKEGGYLYPHDNAPSGVISNPYTQRQQELLTNAGDQFRFDASDLMPSAVGAGAFWEEMTAYTAGDKELEPALQAIDDAWPEESS